MNTTYRFTLRAPLYCELTGLHHSDGDTVVLDGTTISFHWASDPAGSLTLPASKHAQEWINSAIDSGRMIELAAKAPPPAKPVPAKEPDKADAKPAK